MRDAWLAVGFVALFVSNAQAQDARLIEEGRRLFFEETFNGNGRTCGTCHPASNNFTIDPAFIATLPPDDPLFVAEFNPDLSGLENPALMRGFGLILENLDGFGGVAPVFRGVPHTLGMSTTLEPDEVVSSTHAQATGWSGDGSPSDPTLHPSADGSLRAFAIGAVVQHFPRSLNRIPGIDFRLPTEAELDAMEAFQLSLGRRVETVDLTTAEFRQPIVERGRELFEGIGTNRACSACHSNAGALNGDGINANFDTGVRQLSLFGFPDNGLGDGTFNTASLIEAARTPPLFHNNSAPTIEEAVAFYTSPTFAASPVGTPFGGAFALSPDQVNEIAAMLRTLSAIDVADNSVGRLRLARRPDRRQFLLQVVIAEINSAIRVLTSGPVLLGPTAVEQFTQARDLVAPLFGREPQNGDTGILTIAGELLGSIRGLLLIDNVQTATR
jgi:mono/diheme cytochrome c family protein